MNVIALVRLVHFGLDSKNPQVPDATKNSGLSRYASSAVGHIPTLRERARQHAVNGRAAARYTEHGTMMNANDSSAPEVWSLKDSTPTKGDEAAPVATRSKAQAQSVQHGIMINLSKNPATQTLLSPS
jgi:transcription elongation factor